MVRISVFSAFLVLMLQSASAQIMINGGAPASALSPRPDGSQINIPASAISPRPLPPGVNPPLIPFRSTVVVTPGHVRRPLRPFGTNHRQQFIPQVPLFYPVYGGAGYDYYSYPSIADPMVSQEVQPDPSVDASGATARNEDALRQAYMKGAQDALAAEERGRQDARSLVAQRAKSAAQSKQPAAESQPPEPDNSPTTVFIFKDGHQLETKNYAIMGQTLYDLSTSVVTKVQLADVDKPATVRANDDRGIIVKLP